MLRVLADGGTCIEPALFESVYGQLHHLARHAFRGQGSGATMQPTVLVHEAWMKLEGHLAGFRDREHFLAVASLAMRQVLRDHAAAARAQKRGGGLPRVTVTDLAEAAAPALDLVALDEALDELARLHPRHARVVELRFLASLTIAETARTLGVGESTVEADWAMARAWLRLRLAG